MGGASHFGGTEATKLGENLLGGSAVADLLNLQPHQQ